MFKKKALFIKLNGANYQKLITLLTTVITVTSAFCDQGWWRLRVGKVGLGAFRKEGQCCWAVSFWGEYLEVNIPFFLSAIRNSLFLPRSHCRLYTSSRECTHAGRHQIWLFPECWPTAAASLQSKIQIFREWPSKQGTCKWGISAGKLFWYIWWWLQKAPWTLCMQWSRYIGFT